MINIPSNIHKEIVEHARNDFPLECCGILGGKDDDVSQIYKITNTDSSKVSYLMDPKEQIRVFKEMRNLGLELKAIYHSHPNHPAYPSMTDVNLAYYPEAVYIIISIKDNGDYEMRAYRIIEREISEVEFKVI